MKPVLVISIILGCGAQAFAGGTTAAFLRLGSGARLSGLGDAGAALAENADAVSYNPAGLALARGAAMGLTRAELVDGVSYSFLGYSRPLKAGALGLGVGYLGQASMEGRGPNREVTGSFGASDAVVNLAYGRAVGPRAGLGLNFKYITSHIADERAAGWAVDAGWRCATRVNGLSLGLAVQNLGPKLKYIDEADALPLTARAGVGLRLMDNVLLALDVDRRVNEKRTVVSLGSEFAAFNSLYLRAGYMRDASSGVGRADGGYGFKTGFGLKARGFNLDYAVTPFGDIGKSHRVTLGMAFK